MKNENAQFVVGYGTVKTDCTVAHGRYRTVRLGLEATVPS